MPAMRAALQLAVSNLTERAAVGSALAVDFAGARACTISSGFADLGRTKPFSPDLLFQIGSQTKMLVAAGVLLLERDGKLTLDDDVHAHYPEAARVTGGRKITVAQLLNHTSGLGNFTEMMNSGGWLGANWPPVRFTDYDLLTLAAAKGVSFAPGERASYSNTNYILLGLLIERVAGMSSTDFIRRRVFEPLGMSDTYFGRLGDFPRDRLAEGGVRYANSPLGAAPQPDPPLDLSWASSAGDAISSLDQMLYFAHALIGWRDDLGLKLEDFMRHLAPPSEPWAHFHLLDAFGLGMAALNINGRVWYGHSGGTASHMTITAICPELDAAFSMATTYVASIEGGHINEALRVLRQMVLCIVSREAERAAGQ